MVSIRDRNDTCDGETEMQEAQRRGEAASERHTDGGWRSRLLKEREIDGRRLEEIGLEDLAVDEQCS